MLFSKNNHFDVFQNGGISMYLISAYFDNQTTKQLQRYINSIAEETGNIYMTENNVPPHMTISSFEIRKPEDLVNDFYRLKSLGKCHINIISVGEFLPYVIYAAPVLNKGLQHLSESIYNHISVREDVSISKCYQPFSWFPHITLGKKLDKEQMVQAFQSMQIHFTPIQGQIVSLGLAETNPHRDIVRIDLHD